MTKIKLLIIIGVVLLLSGLIFFAFKIDEFFKDNNSSNETKYGQIVIDGVSYKSNSAINILIMGIDQKGEIESSGSYNNTGLNDFLGLITIDTKNETFSLIQINRDTMAYYDRLGSTGRKVGETYAQIAYAHTEGDGKERSCKNTVNAVSKLLYGVNIEGYLSLNMDGVPILVDKIEGVDITLNEDQDLTGEDPSWTPGSTIHLNGTDSLRFIRARMNVEDGTNIMRMKRQRQFIRAVLDKLKANAYDEEFYYDALYDTKEYVLYSISAPVISNLSKYFRNYTFENIYVPEGTTTSNNGLIEFRIDPEYLKRLVIDLFAQK